MSKKRGTKASYVSYGGQEVKELVNGKEVGVSIDRTKQIHYTMLPDDAGSTKRKWLSKDLSLSVATFKAIVREIKGEKEKTIPTAVKIKQHYGDLHLDNTATYTLPADETNYIEWLKREIQNPRELAKKTGIQEFVEFGKLLAKDTNILLKDLLKNYLAKKKEISQKERDVSETWFNTFCDVSKVETVEELTLKDIQNYEDHFYKQSLSPKTIKNRLNKVSTIFKYNTGRYNSPQLLQVYQWFKNIERPQEDKPYNPVLMTRENFEKLYAVSNLKFKAVLMLSLNAALYPVDVCELKRENIDLDNGTVVHRRKKTGKVLAVAIMWDRTKKVLKEYLKTRKDTSPYVFTTLKGTCYDAGSITKHFYKSLRGKAGVSKDVFFSHLRDTFATLAQDLGYTLEQVNLVLGHSTGINDRYAARQANKLVGDMCASVEQEFFKGE